MNQVTKDPTILILMNGISRNTGGMSDALDLAETIHALGFELHAALASRHLYYRLRGQKSCSTTIPNDRIITIPKQFSVVRKPTSRSATRRRLKFPLRSIAENRRRFLQVLERADLVIEAVALTAEGVRLLKRSTGAQFLKHHAGSPEAFEEYWIKEEHLLDREAFQTDPYREFCKRYDGLLFQAQDHAYECVRRTAMPANRCFVLPPSCQEEIVLAAKRLPTPYVTGRSPIVCVGSIQPRKAQHQALEAFSQMAEEYPAADLHFVGGGTVTDYARKLADAAKQLNLQHRIFFHGHRPDYLRFMTHAALLLQSSAAEGVSRVLREAMLMKLPIVSYSISGTASILEAEKEALLVPREDTGQLAAAIRNVLSDKTKTAIRASAAHRRYLANHSRAAYASHVGDSLRRYAWPGT